MRSTRWLPCLLFLASTAAVSQPVATGPFQSVALRNGGEVIVRYGPVQSVQIIAGSPRIAVVGTRLVVDNRRGTHDPRPRVEVVTPSLSAASVHDGGRLRVEAFPRQPIIAASVAQGGMLDLRQLPADRVTASVNHGGIIWVQAIAGLDAAISQGGNVTYWGSPTVKSSVHQGGAISRGRPDQFDTPL
jgi:hypothetical protein